MSFIPANPGSEVVFSFFFPVLAGTHARLSTRHTDFEEREYVVLIRINDGGRPPLEGIVSLPGRYSPIGNSG